MVPLTYCWAESHRDNVKAALSCRFPGHKATVVCDSRYAGRDDVRCITEAGPHDSCHGPNGPSWPHDPACECVEVRRCMEDVKRRNTTRAAKDPAQRRLA